MKSFFKILFPQSLRNYFHLFQAILANLRYGFPSRKLIVIGVTGTDGKTTTTNLIYHLLKGCGQKVSMISTIKAKIGDKEYDTGFHVTSPDPWLVPKYLKQAVKAGSKYMVLEVTSHALDQNRMTGINYEIGVLTNVTHEHLDYHKNYDNYLKTKMKLLKRAKIAVVNADDGSFLKIKNQSFGYTQDKKSKIKDLIEYGIRSYATINDLACHLEPCLRRQVVERSLSPLRDPSTSVGMTEKCVSPDGIINDQVIVQAENVKLDKKETKFQLAYDQTKLRNVVLVKKLTKSKIVKQEIISPLLGDYNVSNLLAAFSVCLSLGMKASDLAKAITSFEPLSGRFEIIDLGQDFQIIIDFAHTPGALAKVLPLAQNLITEKTGKLIHVFGSAGLRDHTKRPLMGEISGKYADLTILTAEDPRTEDVNEIVSQIAAGCEKSGMKEGKESRNQENKETKEENHAVYFRIPDRQKAINFVIQKLAQKGDLVIITGKGHETSMCFGKTEYPWTDQEAVKKALKKEG